MTSRAKRVLFLANDGLGAGHVTRSIALMMALDSHLQNARIKASLLLATTSEADSLLRATPISSLRLPSATAAQKQGLSRHDYQRLLRGTLQGLFSGFSPDLLVVDTFPAGPHLELDTIVEQIPLRVLIQRSVKKESCSRPEMITARDLYHKTLAPGDPTPQIPLWPGMIHVPPITLSLPLLHREDAKKSLGIALQARAALLNPGGGGDQESIAIVEQLRPRLEEMGYQVTLALGPLSQRVSSSPCPLQPYLKAFDLAIAAAGYNSAHELAEAGVPTALFPRPRDFDDQQARALCFQKNGFALFLDLNATDKLNPTLRRLESLSPPTLSAHGAQIVAIHLAQLLGVH